MQTIGLGYDNANRRTSTTLANGMKMVYGLDDGGQLQTITYLKADGATQFGTLNYGYDAAGRRSSQGGTLASLDTGTTSMASASFDANNKLTSTWGATTPSYDNNGNMTGDGTRVYNWNERDQLTSIAQGATTIATFQYDALGRRVIKTINATTTGFLYNGWNVVQELASGTTNADHSNFRANLLNGLRLDERYLRIAGTGATAIQASFLTDALGSTIALTNPDGSVEATYTYQPYGATTQVTPAGQVVSDNSFQYTGRENDIVAGIYYYRTRYYSSALGRFLHEDRIGLNGGQNFYEYANGNSINYKDPHGTLIIEAGIAGGVGALAGWIGGALTGDTGAALVADAAAGFGSGFLIGMTDGLSLLASPVANQILSTTLRVVTSSAIEVERQIFNIGDCKKPINWWVVGAAGLSAVVGDVVGSRIASANAIIGVEDKMMEQFGGAYWGGAIGGGLGVLLDPLGDEEGSSESVN